MFGLKEGADPAVRRCRELQDPEGRPRRRDPVVAGREWALAGRVPMREGTLS
jgi:hypothetical protein